MNGLVWAKYLGDSNGRSKAFGFVELSKLYCCPNGCMCFGGFVKTIGFYNGKRGTM